MGGTSSIYPIRGSPGDFVNVTQAEFSVLTTMVKSQGLIGSARQALDNLLRVNNKGVNAATEVKLLELYNSRQP
jgi:hypothetical protein